MEVLLESSLGVVYTRPWVVELVLDLAGYCAHQDLVAARAVEPAAGEGAFLVPMVQRLLRSCQRQRCPWLACRDALRAYELDGGALASCRIRLQRVLAQVGVPDAEAQTLLQAWLVEGDYLLVVGEQVAPSQRLPQLFDEPPTAAAAPNVDFVLGNPPYVRLESIPEAQNVAYRQLYPTMRGRADLYVGFYEAALRQLRPGGVCAFVCADRWMLNQYGAELRAFISAGFAVETLIELHQTEAFEAAVSAYPAITVLRRAAQGAVVVAQATRELAHEPAAAVVAHVAAVREPAAAAAGAVPGLAAGRAEQWFTGGEPWPRLSPARTALLAHLEAHFPPLVSAATGTRVGLGIATGADAVFFTVDPARVEPAQLRRLARPADVRTGELVWGGQWLISPWHQGQLVNLSQRPRLAAHLAAHRPLLEQRHVAQRNPRAWYRTIDKVDEAIYSRAKLYIPDIKNTLFPVLDRGQTYPDHNLYFIVSEAWDLEVLGGLLLSDVGTFFVACYGVRMRGGYLRMQAQYLRKIRVPVPAALTAQQAQELRQAFRTRDVAQATRTTLAVYGIEDLWRAVHSS